MGLSRSSSGYPLALFSYQMLSQDDYTKFTDSYLTSKAAWATQDFGKPGVGRFNPESRNWEPVLRDMQIENAANQHRLVATLAIEDAAAEQRGLVRWPTRMYLEVILRKEDPTVALTFYSIGKAANRMPEAMVAQLSNHKPPRRQTGRSPRSVSRCRSWMWFEGAAVACMPSPIRSRYGRRSPSLHQYRWMRRRWHLALLLPSTSADSSQI